MFLLLNYCVVSYFENIPSLQFSANALTVAHVIVSIFQKIYVSKMLVIHTVTLK